MTGAGKTPSAPRYRTIVADPPWPIQAFPEWRFKGGVIPTPYPTMTVEEIASLPVAQLAEGDKWHVDGARGGCNLFLWATTEFLVAAHEVCKSWRFKPTALLVWCKPPLEVGLGGTFKSNVEFVVVGRRGSPPRATGASGTRWFQWPRQANHSQKPEAFLDLVERISVGPYLELFARRNRLGWDTWGNEALEHVEVAT